jgi:short-subunit dehydrogenase
MHIAITGASSGIGEALARELGRAGAKLTLVARRRELLEKLAQEIGNGVHVVTKDLSDPANATDWIAGAEAAHGPIDVLVNNAGIENSGPFELCDEAGLSRLFRTNLETPVLLARKLVPAMVARGSGTIVNVASVAALSPVALQSTYAASKAALATWSETLRNELRTTGVHVLTVYPGPVKTAMADAGYEAFGGRKGIAALLPEGTPETLARRVRRAIDRRRARVIYPRFYTVSRCFPAIGRALSWLAGPSLRAEATSRVRAS